VGTKLVGDVDEGLGHGPIGTNIRVAPIKVFSILIAFPGVNDEPCCDAHFIIDSEDLFERLGLPRVGCIFRLGPMRHR